ncbi:MAG: hypothetical protein RMM08_09350 [Armatimonadota bacterium]|nr:sulfur globule family protein [bacterium]MDW8321558.1 hypothetical protein [Armatimonadota bacterium]
MLKLNLLPPNIYEPRKKRAWFAVFVVVWIVLAGGLVAWQLSLVNLKSQKSEELQQQEAIVQQVTQTEQEAQRTKSLVAPLLTRAQLADEVFRANRQYPKLYREVRRWTIDTVRYGSMGVAQGMTLQAQAVTRDLDEMARYLQIMLQCPLFTGVSISWTTAGGATTGAATRPGGFGGMGAPPFGGGTPYGAYGAPYGAPTGVPGMPGAAPTGMPQSAQQTNQGVVFTVVATLREPLMNQVQQLVQQLVSSLGGFGTTGMGGMGAGMGGLPGAPMMGGPMMGGPMMGGPSMSGPMMGGPTMGGPPRGVPGAPPAGAPGGMGGPLGGRGAVAE